MRPEKYQATTATSLGGYVVSLDLGDRLEGLEGQTPEVRSEEGLEGEFGIFIGRLRRKNCATVVRS